MEDLQIISLHWARDSRAIAENHEIAHCIDEAKAMERKPLRWKRWAGLAAALALIVGAMSILPNLGGGAGGAGSSGSSTFMSYAGPILPLTLREENNNIAAEREVLLDFAPWIPVWRSEINGRDMYDYSENILVTDTYTMTNTSSQEQTVAALYPFVSNLYEIGNFLPALTLNGQEIDAVLCPGSYSGGFYGAWGSHREDLPEVNLAYAKNWEAYREILADGSYAAEAAPEFPDLSGVPVTVYDFTDPWGPQPDRTSDFHPTIRASFMMDFGQTSILTTGFHGGSWDPEKGAVTQSYTIPLANERGSEQLYRIIAVGEDIRDLSTQVYNIGGPTGGSVIEEAGVTVLRSERDLESVLREIAIQNYGNQEWAEIVDFALYFGLMKDQLAAYYGILDDDPAVRHADGMISDSDMDFAAAKRVFYLEAEITIPAGQSVTLSANMTKKASFDFHCANAKNRDIYGFDLTPELGSNLLCISQCVTIEDREQIKIVRDNFGFDLKNGIKTVELDLSEEHYYLEVKRVKKP